MILLNIVFAAVFALLEVNLLTHQEFSTIEISGITLEHIASTTGHEATVKGLKVGIVDLSLKTTTVPVFFNEINLRDMIPGFDDFKELEKFGSPIDLKVTKTPAESDYYYSFENFELIVTHLYEKPQLTEFIVKTPENSLKIGKLVLTPGMTLDDLAVPFQNFANNHKILPEFGVSDIETVTKYSEYSSVVRIVYDLETEEIQTVMLLANPL